MNPPALDDAALLARLVAFDSVSGRSNVALCDFVANYLTRCGASVEQVRGTGQDRMNLVARAGPPASAASRAGLVLCGHSDVVPADEPEWESDPFALREAGERLIGRGACDMKGFVALAINRVARAASAGAPRRHPLCLLLCCDEEVGSLGARVLAGDAARIAALPRHVLIGEPTGGRVIRMHKGHLKLALHLTGRAAHSGLPHLGVGAIDGAADVLFALRRAAARLAEVRTDTSSFFPECPYPALNVGLIRGGAAVNIVPADCRIDVGIRLLPGQAAPMALDAVREELAELPAAWRTRVRVEVINDNPPMLCPAEAAIHQVLTRIIGQSESLGVSFASDAGVLSEAGMSCVLWGPGEMDRAHRPNEFITRGELTAAGTVLDRLISEFCA
ncbi:MAG: acetylornithine deacetylase [Planctomycetia bacterium]|nr:MAG: acetylornithine deacetylase [Planctomycetia bacterium]